MFQNHQFIVERLNTLLNWRAKVRKFYYGQFVCCSKMDESVGNLILGNTDNADVNDIHRKKVNVKDVLFLKDDILEAILSNTKTYHSVISFYYLQIQEQLLQFLQCRFQQLIQMISRVL